MEGSCRSRPFNEGTCTMLKILFMCVANSARSQMAEGLARNILGDIAEINSAGSEPRTVNPFAIRAMQEIGIDLLSHHSKAVEDLNQSFVTGLDFVVTLCAEEVCPVVISKAKKLHWPFPDPAPKSRGPQPSDAEILELFRTVRDGLAVRLRAFRDEIPRYRNS